MTPTDQQLIDHIKEDTFEALSGLIIRMGYTVRLEKRQKEYILVIYGTVGDTYLKAEFSYSPIISPLKQKLLTKRALVNFFEKREEPETQLHL